MSKAKRSNWIIYVLVAMFFGPLLVSWAWFFYFKDISTANTVNQGELITPARRILTAGLLNTDTLPPADGLFTEKWTILLVGRNACDANCENMLYQTRQVWIRLGKESHRVIRVFAGGVKQSPDILTSQHQDALYLYAERIFFEQLQSNADLEVFLIDPRGFLVLRYNTPLNPASLYKDLSRLLKYSKIG